MLLVFAVFGIATAVLFFMYSIREGSIINALTIYTALKFMIEFVLEPISYVLKIFDYDVSSMTIIYALSFVGYAALLGGTLMQRKVFNAAPAIGLPNILLFAWLLLIAAWLIYLPVIIEFRDLIFEPRRVYELTRTGYGIYTFGSALLLSLSYIVFMMSNKKSSVYFYIVLFALIILKGQKAPFVGVLVTFIIAKVYFEGYVYSVTRTLIIAPIIFVIFLFVFALNFRGEVENIIVTIAAYSDYDRNAALVIRDNSLGSYGGIITSEMNWIPKIPREFWPDKPKIFGEFRLAAHYFPKQFFQDQGAPSFGIGIYLADFGYWAFLIYPFTQFVFGILLIHFVNRFVMKRDAASFVMVLYIGGLNLLATGSGVFLVEHWIVAVILAWCLRLLSSTGASRASSLPSGRVPTPDAERRNALRPALEDR